MFMLPFAANEAKAKWCELKLYSWLPGHYFVISEASHIRLNIFRLSALIFSSWLVRTHWKLDSRVGWLKLEWVSSCGFYSSDERGTEGSQSDVGFVSWRRHFEDVGGGIRLDRPILNSCWWHPPIKTFLYDMKEWSPTTPLSPGFGLGG